MSAATRRDDARFFFVHLQKTAGTTLFMRLRHHFGPDAVYPTPEYQGQVLSTLDPDVMLERFHAHRDEIRVITGHFPLCTVDRLGMPFTTLTLLREPVERTLSFLRHQREVAPEFATSTLEEIYATPLLRDGLVRNHMVRMLALSDAEMTGGALTTIEVDEARLALAQRNLAERIDVMGLQEDFDGFCDLLVERFGWDLGPPGRSNRTEPVEVSDELRADIARDNAMDIRLYDFAVRLWHERKDADVRSGT